MDEEKLLRHFQEESIRVFDRNYLRLIEESLLEFILLLESENLLEMIALQGT
jgi:hypothetical protein